MVLKTEIETDPLGRGYSAMPDIEAAADLNTGYRSRDVESVSSADIYDAIDRTEYAALNVSQKSILSDIFSLSEVRVQGNTRAELLNIFSAGTETRDSLTALTSTPISRGVELGLGIVKPGHVEEARR